MNIRHGIAIAALTAVAVPVTLAAPAQAGGDEVIRRGSCTGSTDWKLKAKHDDGRLEVEGEVDSNRNGQTWRWRFCTTDRSPPAARPGHTRPAARSRWSAGWSTCAAPTPSRSGRGTRTAVRSAAARSASERAGGPSRGSRRTARDPDLS